MTDWNYNPTMKKLSKLEGIGYFDTPEGKEIEELLEGMAVSSKGRIDTISLAIYAYTLGIARGKQIDRARRARGARRTASGQEVAV
mgnify:CR=1 FL=1